MLCGKQRSEIFFFAPFGSFECFYLASFATWGEEDVRNTRLVFWGLFCFCFQRVVTMSAAMGLISKGKEMVQDVSALDSFADKLKKLLATSIKTAIEACGKEGGFLDNDKIKILFPKSLASVEKVVKKLGKEEKLREFEISMNRAAESAVPQLTEIFMKAIEALTFKDAKTIFQGGDENAGTKYLEQTCTEDLDKAVTPHVQQAMEGTGAHDSWTKVRKVMSKTPMKSKGEGFDLIKYVVKETLGGLFQVCGQFESEYRKHLPKV